METRGCPSQGHCREAAAKSRRWWDGFCSQALVAVRLERGDRAKGDPLASIALAAYLGFFPEFISLCLLPACFGSWGHRWKIEKGGSGGVVGGWKERKHLM